MFRLDQQEVRQAIKEFLQRKHPGIAFHDCTIDVDINWSYEEWEGAEAEVDLKNTTA